MTTQTGFFDEAISGRVLRSDDEKIIVGICRSLTTPVPLCPANLKEYLKDKFSTIDVKARDNTGKRYLSSSPPFHELSQLISLHEFRTFFEN